MVYHNKVVATVKVAGKVLREDGNLVTLPFGAEYSIYIKNLNSVRIKTKITIDGKDVADGQTYIVDANSELNLERYMIHGNYNSGNRFKFIERTAAVEAHRGIKAEDGLIRIEYWTEKRPEPVQSQYTYSTPPVYLSGNYQTDNLYKSARIGGGLRTQDFGGISRSYGPIGANMNQTVMNCSTSNLGIGEVPDGVAAMETSTSISDRGITVPGSQSNQQFVRGCYFTVEPQSEVIVLQLRGEIAGQPVLRPMTVDTKRYCQTCGKRSIGFKQYCGDCGTALVII